MRFSGHTPLQSLPPERLADPRRALLNSLWVESVEEFAAMMAAMEGVDEDTVDPVIVNPLREAGGSLTAGIPAEALAPWVDARPGGMLGCRVDPDTMQTFRAHGRLSLPGAVMPQLSGAALPPSVRLMGSLFPVRDQGRRGTCVAFATTALREYLDQCSTELSQQFLYWACKQYDGFPNEPGTYVRTSMNMLGTLGICGEEVWPYNPEPIPGNESQGPPPPDAEERAREFLIPNSRPVAEGCVNQYKVILAGAEGYLAMPIVIGVLVFNSWYRSAATRQTGKVTMPLPGEQPVGAHAMLVAGYQDDTSVPGGGYFIVRNSWSTQWASQSPEEPGYALMPYAYVERYVHEAFTGAGDEPVTTSETKSEPKKAAKEDFEVEYVGTLRQDCRDVQGKKLPAGTRVIRHPDHPDEIMADTVANRTAFKQRGYTWSEKARAATEKARAATVYPPMESLDDEFRKEWERSVGACRTFRESVDRNVTAAKRKPLPDANLPPWFLALAWMPKVSSVEMSVDLTDELIEHLRLRGGAPEALAYPGSWSERMRSANALRVYELTGMGASFHVVSAFLSPAVFGDEGDVAWRDPTVADAELIRKLYEEWRSDRGVPTFTFFTFGAYRPWPTDLAPVAGGADWLLLSARGEGERWTSRSPSSLTAPHYLLDFLDRLHPETEDVRMERIREAIDKRFHDGYEGNVSAELIARDTGYREAHVHATFRALQAAGKHHCSRLSDGRLVIRKGAGKNVAIPNGGFSPMHVLMPLLVAFVSVAAWKLATVLLGGEFDWKGLFITAPCVYLGKCVAVLMDRKQDD